MDDLKLHSTRPTPTPWKVITGSIYAADGTRIAMMDRETTSTSPTERDANAHFIVEAVNAYRDPEQERMRDEARHANETRHDLRHRLDIVEFALADIREVLRDQNHSGTAYEQEKLAERDNLLGEYQKIKTQLLLIG